MKNTFIGTPMERREDLRFLRGRGEYVDDVAMPGLLYAVILRSSVAHGRLVSIDASAALKRARRARRHHRAPTCRAARRSCRCGCSRCRSSSRSSSR